MKIKDYVYNAMKHAKKINVFIQLILILVIHAKTLLSFFLLKVYHNKVRKNMEVVFLFKVYFMKLSK